MEISGAFNGYTYSFFFHVKTLFRPHIRTLRYIMLEKNTYTAIQMNVLS